MQALCEHGAAGHHIALDWRVEWAAGKVRTRVLAKARSSDLEGATATIASPARLLNACKAALATADSIALMHSGLYSRHVAAYQACLFGYLVILCYYH